MNFNSNPNCYSCSYSYLQAIFSPFSPRSPEPTLVSWQMNFFLFLFFLSDKF